jgi:hypothetical protein
MSRFVVDTNVPIVANGRSAPKDGRQPSAEARLSAIRFLERVLANGRILLDAEGDVQAEYHRHLNPRGQPGVGDLFYLTVLHSAPRRTERHSLPKRPDGEYADCPQALINAGFDPSDRKFAALARQQSTPVANAIDTDWLHHRSLLRSCGITVHFVCGTDATKWWTA